LRTEAHDALRDASIGDIRTEQGGFGHGLGRHIGELTQQNTGKERSPAYRRASQAMHRGGLRYLRHSTDPSGMLHHALGVNNCELTEKEKAFARGRGYPNLDCRNRRSGMQLDLKSAQRFELA
jgi:hypothetical protein